MSDSSEIRPRKERGIHCSEPTQYGKSVLGAPLEVWGGPEAGRIDLLVFAGIHGEEADTTVILSKAVRTLKALPQGVAVITCANPDGVSRGTRGNANGVELNRNFPTSDWSPDAVGHCWTMDLDASDVALSPGASAGSEPETQALMALVEKLQPRQIVSLHGPLGCIDDPDESPLAQKIADRTGLPLVSEIGYPTPGSFGTWCAENGYPVITWEFPPDGIEPMFHSVVPVLVDLLLGEI